MDVKWHVYQFRSDTELLYVGHTRQLKKRLNQHKNGKPWWPEVTDVVTEEFATEDAARQREKEVWATERPKYNRLSPFLTNEEQQQAERERTRRWHQSAKGAHIAASTTKRLFGGNASANSPGAERTAWEGAGSRAVQVFSERKTMSRVKNVSGGPLDVPLLDRVVEDGETVEVPDVQADGESPVVWPGNRWEPVADQVKPEKAAKSAGKAAE